MNAPVLQKSLQQRLAIVDCDIHPVQKSPAALRPYLPARWQEHAKTFGGHMRQGLNAQLTHPRMKTIECRRVGHSSILASIPGQFDRTGGPGPASSHAPQSHNSPSLQYRKRYPLPLLN